MPQLNAVELAKAVENDMIKWRRDLHQIPELGLVLPQTVAYVKAVLDELGIEYEASFVNGNAIVGLILAAVVGLAIRSLWRSHKSGGSCSGDCSNCKHCHHK